MKWKCICDSVAYSHLKEKSNSMWGSDIYVCCGQILVCTHITQNCILGVYQSGRYKFNEWVELQEMPILHADALDCVCLTYYPSATLRGMVLSSFP